jgi:hypothetical protein
MENQEGPYYCFYNTASIDTFIQRANDNYQMMFMAFDNQIKFLTSKIAQLETELEQLKAK